MLWKSNGAFRRRFLLCRSRLYPTRNLLQTCSSQHPLLYVGQSRFQQEHCIRSATKRFSKFLERT
ncbi:hypothetical protein HanIR_Chr17g0852161 [Helianthus annuus]|nr:hypothetical protein HanIR_Chr17g0852161 [Helianthus annuus]